MLYTACDKGIVAVENAPDELKALIAEMEKKPDWLNKALQARYAFRGLTCLFRAGDGGRRWGG